MGGRWQGPVFFQKHNLFLTVTEWLKFDIKFQNSEFAYFSKKYPTVQTFIKNCKQSNYPRGINKWQNLSGFEPFERFKFSTTQTSFNEAIFKDSIKPL